MLLPFTDDKDRLEWCGTKRNTLAFISQNAQVHEDELQNDSFCSETQCFSSDCEQSSVTLAIDRAVWHWLLA